MDPRIEKLFRSARDADEPGLSDEWYRTLHLRLAREGSAGAKDVSPSWEPYFFRFSLAAAVLSLAIVGLSNTGLLTGEESPLDGLSGSVIDVEGL